MATRFCGSEHEYVVQEGEQKAGAKRPSVDIALRTIAHDLCLLCLHRVKPLVDSIELFLVCSEGVKAACSVRDGSEGLLIERIFARRARIADCHRVDDDTFVFS